MDNLVLVGLFHAAACKAAELAQCQVEFSTTEPVTGVVWATWTFSLRGERHEVALVFDREFGRTLFADGADPIDVYGDAAPWKAATVAELIVALGAMPRGTLTAEDWDLLEKAHRLLQGAVVSPLPPPKQLAEGRRQLERDGMLRSMRAYEDSRDAH